MGKLLPCPFCGEAQRLKVRASGGRKLWVTCLNCNALGPDTEDPEDAWNTRPLLVQPRDMPAEGDES